MIHQSLFYPELIFRSNLKVFNFIFIYAVNQLHHHILLKSQLSPLICQNFAQTSGFHVGMNLFMTLYFVLVVPICPYLHKCQNVLGTILLKLVLISLRERFPHYSPSHPSLSLPLSASHPSPVKFWLFCPYVLKYKL